MLWDAWAAKASAQLALPIVAHLCDLVLRALAQVVAADDVVDVRGHRPGSAAYNNLAISRGDRLLVVDGRAADVPMHELTAMLAGQLNSVVEITLRRASSGEEYTVYLRRSRLHMHTSPARVDDQSRQQRRPASLQESERVPLARPSGGRAASLVPPSSRLEEETETQATASTGSLGADALSSPRLSRTEALLKSANRVLERLQPVGVAVGQSIDRGAPSVEAQLESLRLLKLEEAEEVVRLRQRTGEQDREVAHLKGQVAVLQHELQREQASAARISADAQLVRNELEQQCKELEKKLFDSEAARAACERQMASSQVRESELRAAVNAVQEEAEQRERFYGDLCTKLEEERHSMEQERDSLVAEVEAERRKRAQVEREEQLAQKLLERMMAEVERIKAAEARRRDGEHQILRQMQEVERQLQEAKTAEERVRTERAQAVQAFSKWHADFFAEPDKMVAPAADLAEVAGDVVA